MDIIYGISIEYDDMLTILQKVYNDDSFDINTGDYKQYSDDLNDYLKKKIKNFSLKIFPSALIEAERSNNFWTIGYHIQNIGYYSTLFLPQLSKQVKDTIDKDYIKFCKKFGINIYDFEFIIMINDDKLNV